MKLTKAAAILIVLLSQLHSSFSDTMRPVAMTTLSDASASYTVPKKPYILLQRGDIHAIVVDNSPVSDELLPNHRVGYSGLAALWHSARPENLFLPSAGGLNFEFIHDGTVQDTSVLFEPRRTAMQLRRIDGHTVELYQAPTPHWGLESSQRFQLLPDGAIELTFECIPHRRMFKNGYIGLFWANYIRQPEALGIHFMGSLIGGDTIPSWVEGNSPAHGQLSTYIGTTDRRAFLHDPDFPIDLIFNRSQYQFSEPWYYGVSHGMAYILMFRERDGIRFTQSPSGGGPGIPAWDFQFFISDYQIGQRYQMVMRALYVPFESPAQIERLSAPNRKALGSNFS